MKFLFKILFFISCGYNVLANPIGLPTVEISELYFDTSGNWILELRHSTFNSESYSSEYFLYSSTDTLEIPYYIFYSTEEDVYVISNEILNSDFDLNKYGDTIIVECKVDNINYESDILIFGNAENAVISNPRKGQSISRYNMVFVKDNSPSIGLTNDTSGMYGTLSGYVIDIHSNTVCNREFALIHKWETEFMSEFIYDKFETNNDGFYSMRVLSKPTNYELLYNKIGEDVDYLDFIDISYVMEPDSSVVRNVILLEDLKSGISELILDSPIKIFPNPIIISQNIKIEIDLPVLTSDINIELMDISGKLIRYMNVTEKNSEIETPKVEGIYILKVLLGTKQIKSFKIIVKND